MDAKCIKFHEFGNPKDVLKIEDKTVEPPKAKEVLVRMLARPINPSDLIPIRGSYAHRISLPNIPGYEGVGVVEDVGTSVSHEFIGKRVLPLRGEGTWQEFVKTSADLAILLPDSIADFTAAQLYINPLTAWIVCTEVLKLRPDDVLLVNAAGSSIGRIFAQFATIQGFRLISITRSDEYTADLLAQGASDVIDTSKYPLYETVMELTNGRGASAAIDSVGGSAGNELAFCVRTNGNFLTIGLLSGIQVDWADIKNKAQVNATMFHLRNWNANITVEKWQQSFNYLKILVADKKLNIITRESQYNLTNVKEAISAVESPGKNKGKIFLTNG